MKRQIMSRTGIGIILAIVWLNGTLTVHAAEDCEGDACVVTQEEAPQGSLPWSGPLLLPTVSEQQTTPKPPAEPKPRPQLPADPGPSAAVPVNRHAENDFILFQQMAEQTVRNTQDKSVTIETKTWISFNRKVMQAIEETGREVVVRYRFAHETYEVTIPAGTKTAEMLTKDGYCGFLYLQALFGSTCLTNREQTF